MRAWVSARPADRPLTAIFFFSIVLDSIYQSYDRRVGRSFRRGAGGRAASDDNDLAGSGADLVCCNEGDANQLAVEVTLFDQQQFGAVETFDLGRRDHGSHHLAN